MKKGLLVLALLLIAGSINLAQAQSTTTTRGNEVLIAGTPAPSATPVVQVNSVVVTPTPVTTTVTASPVAGVTTTTDTTKGGMPVTGSAEVTVFLALAGIAVMTAGAYKAAKS